MLKMATRLVQISFVSIRIHMYSLKNAEQCCVSFNYLQNIGVDTIEDEPRTDSEKWAFRGPRW